MSDNLAVKKACEYLSSASRVMKSFRNVNVDLCENGNLYVDNSESDETLAVFKVMEGK